MKVKIKSMSYDVKKVDADNRKLDDCRGMIYYENLNIYVDKSLPKNRLEHTVYHELSHAICSETYFNDKLIDMLGEDQYEVFINNLSECLYSFTHDNDIQEIDKFISNKGVE